MNNTSKAMKVFIPFLKATIQVLQEITQEVFIRKNIYTYTGNLPSLDYQVEIGIIGEIRSRVIFSFPKKIAQQLSKIMLDMPEEEIDNEIIEGSIKEIGNMISGNAMGLLEEIGINADITPPKLSTGDKKLLGDQAQLGVLEFNSNLGNFQIAIVTSENNNFLKNDAILSIGLSEKLDLLLSKFLFPKGIFFISASEDKLDKALKKYPPSIIIIQSNHVEKNVLSHIKKLQNTHIICIGDDLPDSHSFKEIQYLQESHDDYHLFEELKDTFEMCQVSIHDNRQNIVLDLTKHTECLAYFLVNTRRGDQEKIPITHFSFGNLVIDVHLHHYINFPERKNLSQKNNPQILFYDGTIVSLNKVQLGKYISNNTIYIHIHNILESEVTKITTFMHNLLSYK